MNKLYIIQKLRQFKSFAIIALVLVLTSFTFIADEDKPRKMVVVIDAGHGGKDPGAICKTGYEKNLVLSVCLKLGKYIEDNFDDVDVIYTRKTDVFVELNKRAKIANKNKADLFISVHANSNDSSKPFGSETFVMGLTSSKSNLAVAKKENSVILKEDNYEAVYEGFDPNSTEGHIIFSLYQNEHLNQSLLFAGNIQNQFRDRVNRLDRGVKQAGFLVLYKTTMPSVLIELGFISNPDEAKFLFSEIGKDYMASAIFRAFREYKKKYFDNDKTNNTVEIEETEVKTEKIDSLYYSYQLLSSTKKIKLKPSKFNDLKDVWEFKIDDMYKYFYGKEAVYDSLLVKKSIVKEKFPDTFPVAFYNGKKISVQEAQKLKVD